MLQNKWESVWVRVQGGCPKQRSITEKFFLKGSRDLLFCSHSSQVLQPVAWQSDLGFQAQRPLSQRLAVHPPLPLVMELISSGMAKPKPFFVEVAML